MTRAKQASDNRRRQFIKLTRWLNRLYLQRFVMDRNWGSLSERGFCLDQRQSLRQVFAEACSDTKAFAKELETSLLRLLP